MDKTSQLLGNCLVEGRQKNKITMSQEPLYGGIDMMNLFESFENMCAQMDRDFETRRAQMQTQFEARCAEMQAQFESDCAEMDREFDDIYNRRVAQLHAEGDVIRASLDFDEPVFGGFDARHNQEALMLHQQAMELHQQAHADAMRQHQDFINQVHVINMHHHNF